MAVNRFLNVTADSHAPDGGKKTYITHKEKEAVGATTTSSPILKSPGLIQF
jgi:hypothetical protein